MIKEIEGVSIISKKNKITIHIPGAFTGAILLDWFKNNFDEIQDFKEENIKGYKRPAYEDRYNFDKVVTKTQ